MTDLLLNWENAFYVSYALIIFEDQNWHRGERLDKIHLGIEHFFP